MPEYNREPRHIERDLRRVNITGKAYDHIMIRKQRHEPFYRLFDRIISSYLENDASDWQQMYYEQIKSTQFWKSKYEELQQYVDKNLNGQTRLV